MQELSWPARCRSLLTGHLPLLLLLAAHLPFLACYFAGLWRQQPHYQFFPFAIVAFVCLFPARKRPGPDQWGLFSKSLIGLDLLCVAVGILINAPWMFAAGTCCVLLAWCRAAEEDGFNRRLTYLALLPLIMLRLPVNADLYMIQMLQRVTTTVASRTLERLGYLHVRSGNVIDFPGKRFLVEEACSGVQSLFTILFIAVLIICIRRRTLPHGTLLLVSGILFAGLMNMIRVISIAIAWDHYQLDLSVGIHHDLLGYSALAIAAFLLLSADSFLFFITEIVPDVSRPDALGTFRNPLTAFWNLLFAVRPAADRTKAGTSATSRPQTATREVGWIVTLRKAMAVVVCVALLALQAFALQNEDPRRPVLAGTENIPKLTEGSMPHQLAGFSRSAYESETRHITSELGQFSSVWDYAATGLPTRVACDYPFVGWHGLEVCYVNQGWQIEEISTEADDNGWQAVITQLVHPTGGRHGVVIYSLFDTSGAPLEPTGVGGTRGRVLDRLFRNARLALLTRASYQSQVFTEGPVRHHQQALEQLLSLHFAARAEMRNEIVKPQN